MTITLNHTCLGHDKNARSVLRGNLRVALRGFRRSLCFSVRVNDTLTLDFADAKRTIRKPALCVS